jgi:hypothetical protein
VNQSSFHKTGDTTHPETAAARHSFPPSIGKADVPLACPSQHQPHKNLPMFLLLECDAVEIAEGFLLIVETVDSIEEENARAYLAERELLVGIASDGRDGCREIQEVEQQNGGHGFAFGEIVMGCKFEVFHRHELIGLNPPL